MTDDGVLAIPANECRRSRWRNGAGWTRQILALPSRPDAPAERGGLMPMEAPPDTDWDLRLSIAEIDVPAAFSVFPGVERELLLLSGEGLRLEFDDGEKVDLLPPHQRARFGGARGVIGIPLDGQVQVFNLMWRADVLAATLLHRPLVGGMWCFCDERTAWAVHVLAGSAQVDGGAGPAPLAQGDSAWLPAQRRRHSVEGAGELLLVRVQWPGRLDDRDWPQ